MPDLNDPLSSKSSSTVPQYESLVRFLVQPFLESPESLRVDCEVSPRTQRVLIRVAFEGEDKGRVFGRGGRNIQAVRTVVQAVAQTAGHAAYLEVFGSQGAMSHRESEPEPERSQRPSPPQRPIRPQHRAQSS